MRTAQISAGMRLYMAQHGDTAAGKKIELIMRDDAGVADNARRHVQEMIVNDNVAIVGVGTTPTALAITPLVTQARRRADGVRSRIALAKSGCL